MLTEIICAVVVTFNPSKDVLDKLISSLVSQCNKIIIVDNSSCEEVLAIHSNCEIIQLRENFGIGYAQNVGIRRSLQLNCTHTILFDQDSVIPYNLISVLKQELNSFSNCAAIGPCFVNSSDGLLYPQIKLKSCKPTPYFFNYENTTSNVMYLIASSCMIKNSVFETIGLMDENFFIDFVDIEWCLRAQHLGFDIKATNKISIQHYIGRNRRNIFGRNFSVHSPFRRYYMVRNSILLSRMRHTPIGYSLYLNTLGLIKILIHSFLFGDGFSHGKMSLKGLYDGIKGISGRLQ